MGLGKNTTQLAKYPRVLYVKPSNKMYLLYGKLRERAVCGKFCVLIGYPSGFNVSDERIILGGDFNVTMDLDLDCSSGNPAFKDLSVWRTF